jgi:hypothetical protein
MTITDLLKYSLGWSLVVAAAAGLAAIPAIIVFLIVHGGE